MASLWSLVEDLKAAAVRDKKTPKRVFSPPIAALVFTGDADSPDGLPATGLPDPSVYGFTEQHVNTATQTTDVAFKITMTPPQGGFPVETAHPELPPPAFRFHAVARGQVSFRPAQANPATGPTLILRTDAFGVTNLTSVPWWDRWVEAHCIPREIHYENVDVDHLRDYLLAIPLAGSHGLKFPESATAPINTPQARTAFVTQFLLGKQGNTPAPFVTVAPGAFIGHAAALDPADTNSSRFVVLHARYADHVDGTNPQPMSPRELLYALFGDTGPMAQNHPLLKQLDVKPVGREFTTKDNVLRPALRTFGRLMWEAGREAAFDQAPGAQRKWTAAANVPPRFDTYERDGDQVTYQNLTGKNKCNVFTSDISVRAGFRMLIMRIREGGWHAPSANSHCHFARRRIGRTAPGAPVRLEIMGDGADAGRLWGWAMTRFLIARPLAEINRMIDTEGRVLILAGARKRVMNEGNAVDACVMPKPAGNPTPPWAHLEEGSGHMAFVQEITSRQLVANNDVFPPGLTAQARKFARLPTITMQASTAAGAILNRPFNWHNGEFIRVHLLEASPGRDPDLLQGLADLHVSAFVANQLLTELDRSVRQHINNSQQCCFDNTTVIPNQNDQNHDHQYRIDPRAVRTDNCT